jgi:hypothetical protein
METYGLAIGGLFLDNLKSLPLVFNFLILVPSDGMKLDSMFKMEHNPKLKLQRRLHARRVLKRVAPVQVDCRQLDLLYGELLADANSGADSKRDECGCRLFYSSPSGSNRSGRKNNSKVYWVLGEDPRCHPHPCTLH